MPHTYLAFVREDAPSIAPGHHQLKCLCVSVCVCVCACVLKLRPNSLEGAACHSASAPQSLVAVRLVEIVKACVLILSMCAIGSA